MSPDPEKYQKVPRKHVTTACVPCRESKIRCDGSTPYCQNCQRKGRDCKYQHGDDKRKVSLRAATELFSARIDQLCQFIYDQGLSPPLMNPEDEAGLNRVLDTLQISRQVMKNTKTVGNDEQGASGTKSANSSGTSPFQIPLLFDSSTPSSSNSGGAQPLSSADPFGITQGAPGNTSFVHWGFTLPTAEGMDTIYANIDDGTGMPPRTGLKPDGFLLSEDMSQQSEAIQDQIQINRDYDSESEEENEAESDVIEQLSNRIGSLKIAGDGHLRFYGATSNLNLVDVSAIQQRQRPDARTVRHDGQDILNHLRVGQTVDQPLEDHLVELYFTWQNPSMYVVDKEMFISARSKWRNEYDDTPFYSEVLTNAMCAIGSAFEARYHPTFITFPKSLAEFFADRAKALLEIELDSPCVATVQALALLSYHEGASSRDARGWLYSGMSMRLAFDLGLHLDMTPYVKQGDISPHEANVRRAAFWGSYVADHFWGFYLGRPFRINAGDITARKPASTVGVELEGTWRPYGLQTPSKELSNPTELISIQFMVLWEMISPVGHILYGCSEISRHDLQRLCFHVTEDLFTWKASLPSNLDIDLDDDTTPKLPHLLILHMQYHQIVIFLHRPWVSKSYIQPRSPRQGPGYHHARRMCIESAIAVARLLHIYEKHYTFRRMNNQVVAIIFSAALMLLFVTVSSSPLVPTRPGEINSPHPRNAEMVAYLNLCFRALDELGQSFENAKRTRDYLVTLQRRWQADMRRTGTASKRHLTSNNVSSNSSKPFKLRPGRHNQLPDSLNKKSRTGEHNSHLSLANFSMPASSTHDYSQPARPIQQDQFSFPSEPFYLPSQQIDLDLIGTEDLNARIGAESTDIGKLDSISVAQFPNNLSEFPDLGDIDGWWGSPNGNSGLGPIG
ncbi:hypothetical protein N7495_003302 [Penicillium taxi]|uniref:uncharacterized protein n=1 Tax=Penicillium taxi TaxID=168475 RepID=UPI00254598FB|nr:uncharacterized protein N7495_003302 [Penicillium taxi]KAJ5902774.1 hypothetical protein N7495_003302 [Penicillium taxi]